MSEITKLIPEVAPHYHSLLEKTAEELKKSPFRGETLREMELIIKRAEKKLGEGKLKLAQRGGSRTLPQIARGAGMALGVMAGGGIALALAGDLYDAAKRGLTKGRNYRRMLEANPDLKNPADAAKVQSSFSTLHRFNPDFSADPYVAGEYVRSNLGVGGTLATVKDLVQSRKAIRESSGLPRMPGSPAILDVASGG